MDNQKTDPVPVLIVGGGVVGLSAALFLLHQGIRPVLVERHRGTSIHPRARGFDIRTMELYRELQISEQIREAGKALAPAWGILTNSSLADALKKVKRRKKQAPEKMPAMSELAALSPETGARCTQDLSEPVLLNAARKGGADIRFYTELVSFIQNEDHVLATIRNRHTGAEEKIRARYMIAADGAKSAVREELQVTTIGKGALADLLNIYFEAGLADFVRDREFSILLIKKPDFKGMLTSINNSDRWVFHLHYDRTKGESAEDYTHERITRILEKVIGLPGTAIRIISILPWQPTIKAVTQMQQGRIFLAGDAAHVMTPYGGKGANTGIQDVHNLAWKLAAVINGAASPSLLQTYNAERQPVGWHNAKQSGEWADEYGLLTKKLMTVFGLLGTVVRTRITRMLGLKKLSRQLSMRRIAGILGLPDYRYASQAIPYSTPAGQQYLKALSLTADPGTRAPHIWIEKENRKISTLDLLGRDFVLFTGTDNYAWKKTVTDINTRLKISIAIYSIGDPADLIYTEQPLIDVFGISDNGAVLVRPDGFVAWRSRQCSDELETVIETIVHFISR